MDAILDLSLMPMWGIILLFIIAGLFVAFSGIRLSALADELADVTGMGEAIMGGVFLGASTSLSGITVSVVAAVEGFPQLSLSNAIGGIAAQMVMLVLADLSYKNVNLEHAAASVENIMSGILQIILLAVILFAMNLPPFAIWGISPVTPFMFFIYYYGIHLINKSYKMPMWQPRMTKYTRKEEGEDNSVSGRSARRLWAEFIAFALVVMGSGWALTQAAEVIVARTPLSEAFVGGVFLAVTTSSAELVTCLAAVRRGALTLAVGDILGGNAFDCLFASVADIFYREGSIYVAVSDRIQAVLSLTIIMAAVLLMGLIARERKGLVRVGFEGVAIVLFYILGISILSM
ncbi:MAG: sodium:calcium antiporter [Chitinispirillaceae bacterium]